MLHIHIQHHAREVIAALNPIAVGGLRGQARHTHDKEAQESAHRFLGAPAGTPGFSSQHTMIRKYRYCSRNAP